MQLSDYTYDLPEDLIAVEPPKVRGEARLLHLDRKNGEINDKNYSDIVDLLNSGDVLVLNDTKVIKARLKAKKANGVEREIVILEKHGFDSDWHSHRVMHRGKIRAGDELFVEDVVLRVVDVLGDGLAIIESKHDLLDLTEKYGTVPLPPYMQRDAKPLDIERYQTVWAEEKGSVAAPTASLNMTDNTLDRLRNKGVKVVYITLHVGLGTFLPIRVDHLEDHHMHQEYFEISKETVDTLKEARLSGGRIVALGTTVTRALEYAYDDIFNQPAGPIKGEADIFIYPGYEFKSIDGLVTNYHAPKSTVLMLTAAFAGWDKLLGAYNHAVEDQYKFFSYGDSMVIL
jgi:S-adenosylmethionine:tRNA ribosyltransferase-isomerase